MKPTLVQVNQVLNYLCGSGGMYEHPNKNIEEFNSLVELVEPILKATYGNNYVINHYDPEEEIDLYIQVID